MANLNYKLQRLMNIKFGLFLILYVVGFSFSACNKDHVLGDLSHLTGNFLCDVETSQGGQHTVEQYLRDEVIKVSFTGDVLHVAIHVYVNGNYLTSAGWVVTEFDFPVESDSQTEFVSTDDTFDATLIFLNNFSDLELNFTRIGSSPYGGFHNGSYLGTRTILPFSNMPHASIDEIEGLYQMDVVKINEMTGFDTTYTENIEVSIDANNYFFFDSNAIAPGVFQTYSRRNYSNSTSYTENTTSITLSNDSIYLASETLAQTSFIISYNYSGIHL